MAEEFDAPRRDVGAPTQAANRRARRISRIIWVTVAIVAALLSVFLSWPWWRDFSYWAESRTMWALYFAVGFVLAVYVFYVFFGNVRTLFAHDAIERAEIATERAEIAARAGVDDPKTDATEDRS